jgi:uncharacterized SAM-binding protein YcdF (DUF218 family)
MNAILILNGGCNAFGELNPDTVDRIEVGMQLAALQPAAQVIMVGGKSASNMRDFAVEHYPEAQVPLIEDGSADTIESAHNVKALHLSPNEHYDVDVATTDFHGPRAAWIFSKILGGSYDIKMHLASSNHSALLKHKERVQFAIAKLKLLGIESAKVVLFSL